VIGVILLPFVVGFLVESFWLPGRLVPIYLRRRDWFPATIGLLVVFLGLPGFRIRFYVRGHRRLVGRFRASSCF